MTGSIIADFGLWIFGWMMAVIFGTYLVTALYLIWLGVLDVFDAGVDWIKEKRK